MERQRSFSFKSTRFLVFSFTFSSFMIFITFLTIWVFKSKPSVLQEASFKLNRTSIIVGPKPIPVKPLTSNFSADSFKKSTLTETHFALPENTSRFASISVTGLEDGGISNSTTVKDSVIVSETSLSEKNQVINDDKDKEKRTKAFQTRNGEVSTSQKEAENAKAITLDTSKRPKEGVFEVKKKRAVNSSEKTEIKERKIRDCDITKGKWVYDESYPLYTHKSCPFIDEGFDCVGNGRLDKDYMNWRWQPQDCDIPRFNASRMLDLIRGKRLVFVGDSINRNQWESLLCMLFGAVRNPKMVYETHDRKITKEKGNYSFKFVDYKCTVEYYVSHFLVHESKARLGQKRVQTLRIDAIDRGSSKWKGADILIFNSAHWWSHYKTKAGINYYQEGNQVHPKLDVSTAFRRALMTWASWVDRHINPKRTQVFFRSSAPSHFRGGQWNSGGHCKEATQPLNETSMVSFSEKNIITEDIIKHMRSPVTLLNITSLSGFRIDGHPSIYGKTRLKQLNSGGQDCSHWCLPGIPDTWNELLFFHLHNKYRHSSQ